VTRWPVANSALNLWEGRPWAARVRPTESSDLARGLSEPKLQVLSAPVVLPASVLVEPRHGLSRARNRALDWCDEDDVLAFVDDDAVVGAGWYSALQRRWDEASGDVACIGGPIRPRWRACW